MAVVKGTNAGFVTAAPTVDPGDVATIIDTQSMAVKDTAPTAMTVITEIGWWCDNATEETNFEVGLYSHDAGADKPGTRLYVDNTNAKGTGAGWKTVLVAWTIVPGTVYWIAVQVDDTITQTNIDRNTDATRISIKTGSGGLADPWPATSTETTWARALYALVEAGATYVDISGTIASVSALSGTLTLDTQVNISGVIAAASSLTGGLILSSNWQIGSEIPTKRLIEIGNNALWYEDI